jgi:hypothetical protein
MFVVYVEIPMTVLAISAGILERTVLCVRFSTFKTLPTANWYPVLGECNHYFHMHCIIAWVRQEASQERCPMCRQGNIQHFTWPRVICKTDLHLIEWKEKAGS